MRKFIRNIIAYFGYDFIKIPRKLLFAKDYLVTLGNYPLLIPSKNPLAYTYRTQADFSTEITSIAQAVFEKYPNASFIDAGANVGDTLIRLKSVNKNIGIICIEGDAFSFSYLQKNSSQFEKVHLFNCFLGEKEQSLTVVMDKAGWNNTIIPSTTGDRQLQLVTLDNLLSKEISAETDIKFIKIDTEGFDTIILRGATQLLTKHKPVIYFEYNRDNMSKINEDGLTTLLSMANYGYTTALFFDDRGRYMLNTPLTDVALITQLHNYADGKNALIYYYNICLVHGNDKDVADKIIALNKQ